MTNQQLSDYQVCHVIGSGSFGTCYKVRNKHTNRFYVWKVIDYGEMSEEKKKLLVSEVNVLSELDSKYIVKYENRIIDPDITTLYIIMEYCPGGDLASLIKKCKRTEQFLEEKFIWKVLYQLSIALHICHSSLKCYQVLHRDIKPANVFLDENNDVKLGDFGLARVLQWDESHSNTIVGTPYYMSPEVIKGGKYNLKSDIWALGCLIYELCSFKPPFHGDNIRQLSQQIMDNGFHRIPVHYSDDLHHIVLYMLSKNNEVRPNIETLLQNPIVVKYTSPYRSSSDPVYKVPKDVHRPDTVTSVIAPEENTQCRNEIHRAIRVEQSAITSDIPPTNSNSGYQNVFLRNATHSDETAKIGEHGNNTYDEIYGTCVDNDTMSQDSSMRAHLGSNYEVSPERELRDSNEVLSCRLDEIGVPLTNGPVDTERSEMNTNLQDGFSKIRDLNDDATENMRKQSEQQSELVENQMRLIRQIFNSKMHMKDILQCCSSDENIYMNSKSILNRNRAGSDRNNNRAENLEKPGENVSKINVETDDYVMMQNQEQSDQTSVKFYLETAIDESFKNNVQIDDDESTNIAVEHSMEVSAQDTVDKNEIMARYQTLEDKMNEIISIQNRNHQMKSNHSDDLELLLKEKLDRIRQHEAYIKHKEKQLQSLELSLNRREKSLALQEKLVQEKIQRAQVYLKQCKESRRGTGLRTSSVPEHVNPHTTEPVTKHHSTDPVTIQTVEKQAKSAHPHQIQTKTSRVSLPIRKSNEAKIPQMKRLLTVDNDSSFSADPGDTSIVPTMSKIDPIKVKPLKFYRHVHFEDQFTELFNDINEEGVNKNKVVNHTSITSHLGNQRPFHRVFQDMNVTKENRCIQQAQSELNRQNISANQSAISRTVGVASNTNRQTHDRDKQITKLEHSTSTVTMNHNRQGNTSLGHRTKQLCQTNHFNQRHSLVNVKLRQFVEQRKPLSNMQTNNKDLTKRHSSPSGLVGPGFITSTLNNKMIHKEDQVKSAKLKTLLPLGEINIQAAANAKQQTSVPENLTGMRKHFVKSKTSLMSNSNIQQCIRRSVRSKENVKTHSNPSLDNIGDGKENRAPENQPCLSNDRRSSTSLLQGMKQVNLHTMEVIRKQLEPLSLQNHAMKPKSNFRDILKTRYEDLELSPVPSEVFAPK